MTHAMTKQSGRTVSLGSWMVAMIAAGTFGLGTTASAQAEPPRVLVVTAENLMQADARHRDMARAGGDSTAILAGDVVQYRLRFTNTTSGPLSGVVFTNPIPAGLRYVPGSASGDRTDVTVEYSIDGGRTYSAKPMVVQVIDGKRVEKPALPEQYSHVRWTVRGQVSASAVVTAEFRAEMPVSKSNPSQSQPDTSR